MMNIIFDKPICFFDCESTGLDIAKERIVSISILKIFPDGRREGKSTMINPTIPIPKEASDIHGITDEMVVGKPTFKQLSKSIFAFMEDCILAGYNNNNYDDQLLAEEFMRCGIEFPTVDTPSIDVCSIFKRKQGRSLSDAVMFFLNKDFSEHAHNSDSDTVATYEVFEAMVNKYEDFGGQNIDFFLNFVNDKQIKKADFSGKIIIDENGEYIWNFGNAKGQKVSDNLGFADWILNREFPETFKAVVRRIKNEILNTK